MKPAPSDPPHSLSWPQLLLFLCLLAWLALAPVVVAGLITLLPESWSAFSRRWLAWLLLSGLLLPPLLGAYGFSRRAAKTALQPLALALLLTAIYVIVAAGSRIIAAPGSHRELFLRLILLVPAALLIGGGGLRWAAGSGRHLFARLGLKWPPLPALLGTLALLTIVTVGWPLTGALGDRWAAQLTVLQTLAATLPEELFFRGAILGLLLYAFPGRSWLAGSVALVIYLAFIPTAILPRAAWSNLALLIPALPLALLLIELRLLSGSLWPGLLFGWLYRATPLLFTDARVEIPYLSEPWQGAAYLGMLVGTGGLALALGLGWLVFKPAQRFSRRSAILLTGGAVLLLGSLWGGLWVQAGQPGFHDDGFLIVMTRQANLSAAETMTDPVERRRFVRQRLLETATQTQPPVRQALEAAGLAYRPFYLTNMIAVQGHHRRMAEFSALPGVERVLLNPNVRPYPVHASLGYLSTPPAGQGVEWNLRQVEADEAWDLGATGQGIVIGGQDTGYDWTHPALRAAYRGNQGGEVSHAFNWLDAWGDSPVPFDADNHGTHTMGIMVGDDGQGNQIGMAPGARWIGCRNMRRGIGNPASYTACMEFFLAPYPPGGDPFTDGDVSRAPHLINNSWGCPDLEGCDDQILQPALVALRAAGLLMVVSAGNSGPACQTIAEPPAFYDEVFSVGATNDQGWITVFSSRGPTPEQANLIKPDITAPGQQIRSSLAGGGYGTADGTSMAGPHVAGLVALIWSANPQLIGRLAETERLIRQAARPVQVSAACPVDLQAGAEPSLLEQLAMQGEPPACACGGVSGSPNNIYGWGEIDARAAVRLALEY